MSAERKKIIVLGTLGLVLIAVGAFQLMPPEAPATKPSTPSPSVGSVHSVAAGRSNGKPIPAGPLDKASGVKPSSVQVSKSSGSKAEPTTGPKVEVAKTVEPSGLVAKATPATSPSVPNLAASVPLPRRDPFDVPEAMLTKVPPVAPPSAPPQPSVRRMPAMKGLTGTLPDPNVTVEPVRPAMPTPAEKPAEPTFNYTLIGVIIGRQSAAVLRDAQGNQRLIAVGGAIDGDSNVLEIRPGVAVINFRGKSIQLEMKGDHS